jgi:uncharacterized protein (DUF4415 family)
MSGNKHVSKPTWSDPDDAPELTDAWFATADIYQGEQLVRRGRPKAAVTKVHTGIRLDADILAAFKSQGPRWQSRMNAALRDWLKEHTPDSRNAPR